MMIESGIFVRVGAKLLQRFGPRRPMIWGSLIVGAAMVTISTRKHGEG
jgi:MFS transporter, DHA2 family, multidrug resistance protein